MRILFLPNWTVYQLAEDNPSLQAPDKYVKGESYWFFRYFTQMPEVDIVDIHKGNILHILEVKLKFYIWQSILAYRKQKKYDIIISHGAQSGVMLALLRCLFGKGRTKHIIFDIGGMNGARAKGFSTRLIQWAMKSNPYIICHSRNILKNLEGTYPWLLDRAVFIPFGIGTYQYTIRLGITTSRDIFVFGGKKRDVATVIASWRKIVSDGADKGYRLLVVGDILRYDVQSCISVGRLRYDEYIEALEKAAFAILPLEDFSYSYGQMSLLGALALGKYVIASQAGGISDYYPFCSAVRTVPCSDPNAMRDAITHFIDNPSEITDRTIPRNEVNSFFNEEDMAARIESFINRVMAEK